MMKERKTAKSGNMKMGVQHKNFKKQEQSKSYKGRKNTIFKMAQELSTLSDVDVLLIVYDPQQHNPTVWCSTPNVEMIIDKYFTKKESESMIENKKESKIPGRKTQQIAQNFPSQQTNVMSIEGHGVGYQSIAKFGREDLKGLLELLEGKLDSINERITHLRGGSGYVGMGCHGLDYGNQMHGSLWSNGDYEAGLDGNQMHGSLWSNGDYVDGLVYGNQMHGSLWSNNDVSTTNNLADIYEGGLDYGDMQLITSNDRI